MQVYSTDIDGLIGHPLWPSDVPKPEDGPDVRISQFEVDEYRRRREGIGVARLRDERPQDDRELMDAEMKMVELDDEWLEVLYERARRGEEAVPLRQCP